MKWINIEKNGLPEPNGDDMYFVSHLMGYGYGTYDYGFGESVYHPEGMFELPDGRRVGHYETVRLKTSRWFLDFDAVGHEDSITHYMKIEETQ